MMSHLPAVSRPALLILFLALFGPASPSSAAPTQTATISVDTTHPGLSVSPDFTGLSFEVSQLLPNADGLHYFRPDNEPLIRLFHTLGIKNLRIGGNTSDRDVRKLPAQADLDSLFGFAQAAGVKVIYCLRLHNGDPELDAQTAKYIMDRYAPEMDCFSIGQEPSAYPVTKKDNRPTTERMGAGNEKYQYPAYAADWKRFADTIIAAVPDAKFCGPSVHNNGEWARKFINDFGRSNHVVLITEHLYPGGAGNHVPTPEIGRARMLAGPSVPNSFIKVYQRLYDSFVPLALSNGLPYRLEEVNNYFNGGATNVSNTFASALWGLDFMYWWAQHDADGLNFHTGDKVAAGYTLQPSKYTAYFTAGTGYYVRPLGYGIKAFDLGSHGRFVPVTIANPASLNLSAYAVLGDDQSLCLTLINKENGSDARNAQISFTPDISFNSAKIISLKAPNDDIAATSGETLGDAEVENNGSWNGHWNDLSPSPNGSFVINLPPASAVVIKLVAK